MSEIDAISSSMPSLIEEVMHGASPIADPFPQVVESSSSIDELKDKLNIIEDANKGQNIELTKSVSRINEMISNNVSLNEIKSSFKS